MKTIRKLNINPQKIMRDKELVTLKGGYEVNGCSEGWDQWLCSYYVYGVKLSGNFCVPTGLDAQGAHDWIEGNTEYKQVNYCV